MVANYFLSGRKGCKRKFAKDMVNLLREFE